MIHYILVDGGGCVRRRGMCASKGEIPHVPGLVPTIIDESDERRPDTKLPVSVDAARSMAYPTVGDQLGAIWKAIAPLIEHPEAEAILAKIQAVKDANPKPSN